MQDSNTKVKKKIFSLEIIIDDDSAEFIETDSGNYLDYTKDALGISDGQD